MKTRLPLLICLVLVWMVGAGVWPASAQAPSDSRLRVLHAVDGAPAVDIYLNGQLVFAGLAFGTETPYYRQAAGAALVEVRVAGESPANPPLFSQTLNLLEGLAGALVLQGTPQILDSAFYDDPLDPITLGLARLAVFHAVAGAPAVDLIRADGIPLLQGISYDQPSGSVNIPSGLYNLLLVPSGGTPDQALAALDSLALFSNQLYTLVVASNNGQPIVLRQNAPTNPLPSEALVRLVHHAALEGAVVDIYLDDTLLAPNVAYADATQHFGLSVGEHKLALRATGSAPNSEPLFEETLAIKAGAQTFAISLDGEDIVLVALADAVEGLAARNARLQVLNFSADTVAFTFGDQTLSATPTSASAPLDLAPVSANKARLPQELGQAFPLFGGTLYSVLVLDAETVLVQAVALNVRAESSPFVENTPVAAQPTPIPTEVAQQPTPDLAAATVMPTPTLPAPPTPMPAPIQATPATPAVVQPTAPPSAAPSAAPTRPGIYPPVEIIFGTVTLNQGVNLQCREYPSAQARSLGLIPNNTRLVVLGLFAPRDETGDVGRFDAILIENVPDFTPILAEDFTVNDFDPTFLASFERSQLWFAIDWILQDNTAFGCWVNAQYVDISFKNKRVDTLVGYLELVEGLNFELIPYNVPGGPRDPNIVVDPRSVSAPTPLASNTRFTATVNVNQGVSLQLRRTPSIQGESLALLPNNTNLSVLAKFIVPLTGSVGEPTVPEWLLVDFLQADGTTLRGWVSAQFVILTFNGRLASVVDVPLLSAPVVGGPVVDDDLPLPIGTPFAPAEAGSAPASTPVPSVAPYQGVLLIDPGATLNLRDRPSIDGIVRFSVPSNSFVGVFGRNGDGRWLNVSYASPTGELTGWMASEFIQVTQNGALVTLQALPITNGEADTLGLIPTP